MKKVILLICQMVVSICCMTAQTISLSNTPDDIVNCLLEAGNDTLLVLNECESKFLNYRLQTQRDTFDFTGKRVAFFRGNTGKIRTSKIFFFDRIKESYNINGYVGNTSINSNRLFLGSYINGDNNLKADPNNYLFQHEYGHYIQSQNFGISYLSRYGIPSGLNCMGHKKHKYHPAEQDANIRAFKYFNKYIDNYTGWEFGVNPIGGYDNSLPYDDSQNQAVLNNGLLRPAWYNYIFPGEILITGIINWSVLENYE